jgi:hypothetical protein
MAAKKKTVKKKTATKKKTAKKKTRRVKIVIKLAPTAPGMRNRSFGDCEAAGCPTEHPTLAGYHLTGCSKNLTENTVSCWYRRG